MKIVPVPVGTVVWFLEGQFPGKLDQPQDDSCSTDTNSTDENSSENETLTGGTESESTEMEEEEEGELNEEIEVSGLRPIRGVQVADLEWPGDEILIARGGIGGRGNASLAKRYRSAEDEVHQSEPGKYHQIGIGKGESGTRGAFLLELKLIADVGLVGAPNAGKSTLLRALSRAQPRIGHYAFTTLKPQLGTILYNESTSVAVADIPGLLEGASQNRGLGLGFLRHIERTKALIFVLDMAPKKEDISPILRLNSLMEELEVYQKDLLKSKPFLIVANKMDENEAHFNLEKLRENVPKGVRIFPTCAVLEEGIEELKEGIWKLIFQNSREVKDR